jgi:hypothetical protein
MIATKREFALAALIVAIGVGTVETSRNTAEAAEPTVMTRIEAYSAARIDTAFDLVAALPASAPFMLPVAQKGDLLVPPGCTGMDADVQAECMDVAYELPAEPSIIIETRGGTTTTLMRMDAMTVADAVNESQFQSE